jgi:hypothetical protein
MKIKELIEKLETLWDAEDEVYAMVTGVDYQTAPMAVDSVGSWSDDTHERVPVIMGAVER